MNTFQSSKKDSLVDTLVRELIIRELERSIEEEFDKVKAEALLRIDKRKTEIISSCALYVANTIDMNMSGKLLTIRLETKTV